MVILGDAIFTNQRRQIAEFSMKRRLRSGRSSRGCLYRVDKMRSASMDRRVRSVAVLMQAELHRSVSLHELAKSVNLSDSRLRHLFKIETGRSPHEVIKALRMQRAKELCEVTFLSIKEIMDRVGIRDPSHFVRDFEKLYGLSPTRFRASYGNKARNRERRAAVMANK